MKTYDRRPKGTGTIETNPDGTYRARFAFVPGGNRDDVGTFASYAEASARLDAILEELRAAGGERGLTLRRLGARALDMREREGQRAQKDGRNLWKNCVESWDRIDVPASVLTRGDLREWLAILAGKKLSVSSRKNALSLMRSVLQVGVDDGSLEDNVAIGLKVKSRGSTAETSTYLTKDEAARLVAASNGDAAVVLALMTGMRSGELRSLLWTDVHEDHVEVRYGSPGLPTKSGKIRKVPLLQDARRVLEVLPRTHTMVLPSITGIHRPKGRLVHPRDWKAWLRAAKIARPVRWHDLRHSCATLLLSGAWGKPWSLEAVKEMLGHSSIKVTERYAKATGQLAEKAARGMRTKRKPKTSPGDAVVEEDEVLEILRRRGSDSNRRMTVLQTVPVLNPRARIDRILGLARAYLLAVAEGSVFSHRLGVDLADEALSLESEDVLEPLRKWGCP